jgi:hypothetical protein
VQTEAQPRQLSPIKQLVYGAGLIVAEGSSSNLLVPNTPAGCPEAVRAGAEGVRRRYVGAKSLVQRLGRK